MAAVKAAKTQAAHLVYEKISMLCNFSHVVAGLCFDHVFAHLTFANNLTLLDLHI